jgi:hypothetical protein
MAATTTGKGDLPKVAPEIAEGVTQFDASSLKHAQTVEKQRLPSVEDISKEKTLKNIEGFNRTSLTHVETTEKNTLPSKEVIQEEKKASP